MLIHGSIPTSPTNRRLRSIDPTTMVRISNTALAAINFITAALALAAIGLYLYLHCQRTLQWPVLMGGLALLAVSVLGLLGSCCRFNTLYLALIFLFMLGWFAFSVFLFTVTNKGAANALSGDVELSYQLGLADYSHWLQKHVVSGKSWRQIRSCMVDANVCKTDAGLYRKPLSPIQSGCCTPPPNRKVNATQWEISRSGLATTNPDCSTWSNERSKLCYNCNSCKAGVLFNIRKLWRHFAVANAVALAIIIAVYTVALSWRITFVCRNTQTNVCLHI